MRRILTVILWLTLVPAAFATIIDDPSKLTIPSNFETCDDLHALYAQPLEGVETDLLESASLFGSLTGFVDFTPTDGFLRFLDEYVVGGLQSIELRDTLQYHLRLDFQGIADQMGSIYEQIAAN